MSIKRQHCGLLAHSVRAGQARKEFLAMRRTQSPPMSNGTQLKYFLLYGRAGMTSILVFAAVMFYAGIGG